MLERPQYDMLRDAAHDVAQSRWDPALEKIQLLLTGPSEDLLCDALLLKALLSFRTSRVAWGINILRYIAGNWSDVTREAAAERIGKLLEEPLSFQSLCRSWLAQDGASARAVGRRPPKRGGLAVIAFQGGLGNQMFQYAAALGCARRRKAVLRSDVSIYRTHPEAEERRYWLHHFCVDVQHASAEELQAVSDREHVEDATQFDTFLFDGAGDVRLSGHWQSELYFRDVFAAVRQSLQFKSRAIRDYGRAYVKSVRRRGRPVVAVHVRRGDFATNPRMFGTLPPQFFIAAASRFPTGSTFIIFSDNARELDWCRENIRLRPDDHVVFAEDHSFLFDFAIMKSCDHNITSVSSFSWWAAWLNPNPRKKIIVPPPERGRGPLFAHFRGEDYTPKSWIVQSMPPLA